MGHYCKSCVRTHFDYGNIIYDQDFNNSMDPKIEILQYNSALALKGAVGEAWKEKNYQKLGLKPL